MREKSHYQVLEVPPLAALEEIKEAYRKLALKYHPDIAGENDTFLAVRDAYKILSNNEERRKYDMVLRLMWVACGNCSGTGVKFKQKGFTARVRILCPGCEGAGFYPKEK